MRQNFEKKAKSELTADTLNRQLWDMRFSDHAAVAEKSRKLLEKCNKIHYRKGSAYARLNLASAGFYTSRNDIALKNLSEAMKWFEHNRHEPGYARALLLKGNIYESLGDFEKTLDLWLKAWKQSVESGDRETEGEACSQLGLIYSRLCNFNKALEFFEKGLKIREELGDENAVASSLNRIGMLLRQTKKYSESLDYYFRSLDIRKKNKQTSAIPWTLLGIAATYEEMKDFEKSLYYYSEGQTNSDKRCALQCMMGEGRVLSLLGDFKMAESKLSGSLRMARELKSQALVAEALRALANHYEYSKQPGKALRHFKMYLKARESFQSSEAQSRLNNIEVAHAIERSEQEKEIYRLKHVELKQAYDIIEEKNKDITASISYASRIQKAMLPDQEEIKELSTNMFILYLPRDIVSGDFYWFTKVEGKFVLAAGDCTGHGVPGALMSMLGISFLDEIVNNRKITGPGIILDELRTEIQKALRQKGKEDETRDGMDMALCTLDIGKRILKFSGAFNNLLLFRDRELTEFRADRMPVGIGADVQKSFTTQTINFCKNDMIYIFSDGYADQFGGSDGKKYKYQRFKETLSHISPLPLADQKNRLESEFLKWKGSNPQTDDVLVMGVRLWQ